MNELLPILIPVGFVLFWCALCFLIALTSGWRALAAKFRCAHTPQGRKLVLQRALINSTRFGGALTFIIGPEGFYLKLWPIFSVFGLAAPALLLPWSELSPLKNGRWTWFETWSTTISLSRFSKVTITLLDRDIAHAISQHLASPTSPAHKPLNHA